MKSNNNEKLYENYLKSLCSLSRLFSDSNIPYLHYRVAENVFCKSFGAENISRSDLSYDVILNKIGIGIKTFIDKKNNNEKIAEFNSFSKQLQKLRDESLVIKLSELRNERINFTNRTYNVKKGIYHCIARSENFVKIFETNYDLIDINNIRNLKKTEASISFSDKINEYSYNFSKSTLYKKFITPNSARKIDISIIDNPIDFMLRLLNQDFIINNHPIISDSNYVVLPLYSLRESTDQGKVVASKSSLNQWNAGGRKRDEDEIYIPIPSIINKKYPKFFPSKETSFKLQIPSGEVLSAKVCQENSKALMTNPNKALSDWLLRKVLKLKKGELLTYDKLSILGVDAVRITKLSVNNYKIDFAKINSFENFINGKLYKDIFN